MPTDQAIRHELVELMTATELPPENIIGPASEDRVAAAESIIGLRFPQSYRLFLLHYGAMRYGNHEIFGLFDEVINEDYGFTDVAKKTLRYRSEEFLRGLVADKLVFFAEDQDGMIFYSDSSQAADGKAPVFASGPNFIHRKLSEDFLDFFRQLLVSDSLQPFGF